MRKLKKTGNIHNSIKPINRNKLRLTAGKTYYTLSRYILWYSGRYKFAKKRTSANLKYLYYSHKTPLLRELKNVDMEFQYNKIVNLKLAVKNIDGLIIKPGETFSYWKLIGRPSARKGYVRGMVLFCGTYHMGIGEVYANYQI